MDARSTNLSADDLFLRVQRALAGEYSIERELGRGGMGVVYLAREVRLAREVAIKVLPPALADSPSMRTQFLREAQMAARLSHPNIVPIHRVDETDGVVYIVMAYAPGETLAERIHHRGPLPPHQATRVLRDVAWALTYAHGSDIVHRDIKADNILLERDTGRALVTDFGIASVAHAAARDANGNVMGSAHYASPEQISGEPLDARSDLYSLGVVGYLALTGRFPFDAPTARETMAMHLRDRATPIMQLAPTTPLKLATVLERCLAKSPAQRFANATAFAEALDTSTQLSREIPAPIRAWIARENNGVGLRIFLTIYLSPSLGMAIAFATGIPFAGMGVSLAVAASMLALPTVYRTRQLVAAGFGIDDIRIGLREYWKRRQEELAFELRGRGAISGGTILTVFGFSTLAFIALIRVPAGMRYLGVGMSVVAVAAVVSAVVGIGRYFRGNVVRGGDTPQTRFWNSRFGEALVRLAGLGLRKRAPAQSLSQLTEVALGRATDALYEALPRPLKKQLRELPDTVRRLEADATRLRAEIEKLDAALAALDQDSTRSSLTAIAKSLRDDRLTTERERLRTDLRATRERAEGRLAASVAALETIRLDLLRLQLGDGRVESVTASLDAANQVADDLRYMVAASDEVNDVVGHARGAGAPTTR